MLFSKQQARAQKEVKKIGILRTILKIITSHTNPHEVALGAAIGIFLSIIPTFSLGMIIALLIAIKFRLNLIATYLGTLVVNPFTASPIYLMDYMIGSFLISNGQLLPEDITFSVVRDVAAQMYLGGIILGTAAAIIVYAGVYILIDWYRARKNSAAHR